MQQIIELIVVITPKSQGEKVVELLSRSNVDLQLMTLGKGTAGSAVADYFDISESEKKVFFALTQKEKAQEIMALLDNTLNASKNKTIVFSLPLRSAMYSVIEQMGLVKMMSKPSLSNKIKKIGERIKTKRQTKDKKTI